ncbi:MAG TPA: Sec-independent protein translocase TatB [Demequinaceae bacterium]
MLDINGQEFVILLLVATVVIGPERLPRYAREFRGLAAKARDLLGDVRASVRGEMDDTVELAALNPRQSDSHRVVKDVAADGDSSSPSARSDGRAARRRSARIATGAVPPFDADAT